jgi:hypothetical protein
VVQPPKDPAAFDVWDPANVSGLVAYLATPDCPFTGQVFAIHGDKVGLYQGWSVHQSADNGRERWSVDQLRSALKAFPPSVPVKRQGEA